jgi:hypothetical protein
MKRALAVIAALAMIAGAIVFRRSSDPATPSMPDRLVVACASVIEAPCKAWGQSAGYDVRVIASPPKIGPDTETMLTDIDLFVAPEPWVAIASTSFPTGNSEAAPTPNEPIVVASSPVVLVARADDQTLLRKNDTAWADAIDAKTRLWGEQSWLAPVVEGGLAVSALSADAKATGEPPIPVEQLAGNDLQTDAVLDALADLAAAQSRGGSSSRNASDAIGAMNAREIDVVATVEAWAKKRPNQRVVIPTPPVNASIAVAIRPGLSSNAAKGPFPELTAALQRADWKAPTTGAGTVGAKLLEGLAAQMPS